MTTRRSAWAFGGISACVLAGVLAVASMQVASPPAPGVGPAGRNAVPRGPAATSQAALPKTVTLNLGRIARLDNRAVTMKLTLIPSGKFIMGSPADEPDRESNEVQHEVTISKPFYMGVIEVTWDQYEAVIGYPPNSFWLPKDPPLETATWEEAVAFCRKLSEKAGKTIRLPTEAEWEYACRAGTKTAYNLGAKITTEQANFESKYDERTSMAGKFAPNAWGLYDMHGNVMEWCGDWYGDYPATPVTDPKGPEKGTTRILRGGSWRGEGPEFLRSALRSWHAPDYRRDDVGFRVVMEAK